MKVSSLAVLGIGIYMLVNHWGPVNPPMLSGIAFTLIGAMNSSWAFSGCKTK